MDRKTYVWTDKWISEMQLEKWKDKFKVEFEAGIDVEYYFYAVKDWANQLNKRDKRRKKTERGWISTGRNFMRADKKNNKLEIIEKNKNSLTQNAINDYLQKFEL